MPDLNLQMPTVPEGFCNSLNTADWVQVLMNLIGTGVAKFEGSGFTAIISQATAPGANDRDKLWRDTDSGIFYTWNGVGAWVTPHPETPSGSSRRMWVGTLNALITYDGGEVGAVSANTGPMWEEDTTYQGRSPMGPGNIPSADPAKNLTVGETCGSGSVTLTEGQGTPHIHGVGSDAGEDGVWMNYGSVSPTAAYNGTYFDQFYNTITRQFNTGNTSAFIITTEMLEEGTASEAHENTHPVIGTYIIKRTARVNYVGA